MKLYYQFYQQYRLLQDLIYLVFLQCCIQFLVYSLVMSLKKRMGRNIENGSNVNYKNPKLVYSLFSLLYTCCLFLLLFIFLWFLLIDTVAIQGKVPVILFISKVFLNFEGLVINSGCPAYFCKILPIFPETRLVHSSLQRCHPMGKTQQILVIWLRSLSFNGQCVSSWNTFQKRLYYIILFMIMF